MLEILDSIIATVAVILIFSLVVQGIQQILKQVLSMKSTFMERELLALFHETTYSRTGMPVFQQVSMKRAESPEAVELIDRIKSALSGIGYNDLSLLEELSKDEFLKVTGDLFDTSELELKDTSKMTADEKNILKGKMDFLQQARWDVERWYDMTLKSFQDHYERRMKMWAYGLSALVVIWLNGNLFEIYQEFSTNKVLRAAAVKMGEDIAKARTDTVETVSDASGAKTSIVKSGTPGLAAIRLEMDKIDSLVNQKSFSLMRWDRVAAMPSLSLCCSDFWKWFWSVLVGNFFGWTVMTLLVGLGAPFWYDALRTLVGVKQRLKGGSKNGEAKTGNERSPATAPKPDAEIPPIG
jgi:hypothetical protein